MLHRATNYPYDRPDQSYVYDDGEITAFDVWPGEIAAGRTPVLAFGSNAAPEQLRRKFGDLAGTVIPVIQADLTNFDVVYSAHLTAYGAVPATLAPSPGTTLHTWITWLDEGQLERMHRSEMGTSWGAQVNYAYGALSSIQLRQSHDLGVLEQVGVYLSNHGALRLDDRPVAFDIVPATGREFSSKSMGEILDQVRAQLETDLSVEQFIDRAVNDTEARAAWTEALRHAAHLLIIPGFRTDDFGG